MTKIYVIDRMPECPECCSHLMATVATTTVEYLNYDEDRECWERGLKSHECSGHIVEIFCQDCGFVLRGDEIHTVEVETWEDKFYRREMMERQYWRIYNQEEEADETI